MRSKRYFAEDLRSAVIKVRHELGPNAIILAHHRMASGVEVTAVSGKERQVNSPNQVSKLDVNTLGIKDARDCFDSSAKGSGEGSAVDKLVNGSAMEQKEVAYRGKIFSAGDTIMHDKKANQQTRASKNNSGNDSPEAVEYDFEAEMDMILNTHYVSLNSSKSTIETTQKSPVKKTQVSVKAKKQSTKKPKTASRIHTALSKLKIQPEEKQLVIHASQPELSDDTLPPMLSKTHKYDEIAESIELQIGDGAYGEAARKNPVKAALIRQLMKLDLSPIIIQNVVDMLVSDKIDQKMLLPQAMALVASQIPIYKEDITSIGGTIALFGATGVGKTTTIAKLAARYALKHGSDKVALITTDDNRVAATEQLRTYSNILGMPLRIARNDIEVLNALNTFSEKEFVLIDTAGMNPREISQSKFYELFAGGITQIKKFQVLPATMNRTALEKITAAFRGLSPDGSIITKVDETTSLGGALSVAIQNHLPIAFYGNGQTVPDDFHLARAHILMSKVASVAVQYDDLESYGLNDQLTPGIARNVSF